MPEAGQTDGVEREVIAKAERGCAIDVEALAKKAMEEEKKSMAPLVAKYRDVSEHALELAFAVFGANAPENTFAEFCKNFSKLKEMGFEESAIAGALKINDNNLQRATDQLMGD